MQKKKVAEVDLSEIPEVVEFLDMQDTIKEFKEEHAAVFAQLEQLTEKYNAVLEQASKAVRDKQVTCGPFVLKHFSTKYDAEALYNAVGRDAFLDMGGKVGSVTTYDLDKGRLEACIAQNKLPPEVVDRVRTETPNYHKVDKLVLP